MSRHFRCAASSEDRAEPLAATASHVRAWLLVEAPGSWGVDAARDNRLPTDVSTALAREANRHRVRLLMIRKHGRTRQEKLRVFAAFSALGRSWAETATLHRADDLLAVDVASLGAGRSAGLTPHHDPMFLVCTHGRHDVCCAERGRPVAAALHRAMPEETWEVSHIGGDRFAGNMLVLPEGVYYGRLTGDSGLSVAHTHRSGHLDLTHLRGRSIYPFAVQAAEGYLRRHLDLTALDALRLSEALTAGDETTTVFTEGAGRWRVRVHTEHSAAQPLTCRAARTSPPLVHRLVSITQV